MNLWTRKTPLYLGSRPD